MLFRSDVVVRLGDIHVVTDFLVVDAPPRRVLTDMDDVLLLGRPFITATKMVIDLFNNECVLDVQGTKHKVRGMTRDMYLDFGTDSDDSDEEFEENAFFPRKKSYGLSLVRGSLESHTSTELD